ncbi:hypothetical protein TUM3794_20670 [Shewanella colwelliana]|uniref:Uncharacterized domain-containing protein n=1 Tax=Shewanella colwelliana TaxID=23 RepID=A0ABQ4P0N6_SHECO|nr:MobH family relaxase [Shewanella colwelliana]GIU41074.1 hypothetical protein TUM3794_20670 [Shewanella colwelliana]
MSLVIQARYLFARTVSGFRDRFGKRWSNSKVSKLELQMESEAKVLDSLLHYPLKTALIPISSAEMLLKRHESKIKLIERDIGLAIDGAEFAQRDLVIHTIRTFIGYCHLIPASEMDHHQYIGGLLEHSLDVSIRSLQNAMSYMLDEMGLIDEDQARRPRYEYAAWVCGLLHDAGKVISNVKVVGENGEVWHPLNENIYEWAQRNNISHYSVIHNKNRLQNDHETNSVHFLPLVLNKMAKDYLLGSHDDLYSMITQTLVHYHSYRGYLFNAVRKADSDSTYADYARVWLHDSSRKKSLTMGVVNALRLLYSDWKVNRPGSDVFIFNGEVYLAAERPIRQVIEKCIEYDIKIPTSARALISILIDKRILSSMSSQSTTANLYLGKFSENDVHQFIEHRTGELANTSPINVIKVEWPNFVIGDNPIPNNVHGALRYNTQRTANVHQLYNDDGFSVVTPKVVVTEEPATVTANEPQGLVVSDESTPQEPAVKKTKPSQKKAATKNTAVKKPLKKAQAAASKEDAKDIKEQEANPTQVAPSTDGDKDASKPATVEPSADGDNDASKPAPVEPSTDGVKEANKPVSAPTEIALPFPWMTKKRRTKPLDEALHKLLSQRDPESIWINDSGDVCVSLDYLTSETGQNRPQVLNALTFMQMLKLFEKKKNTGVVNNNGAKVTYIMLSDDVAVHFTPKEATSRESASTPSVSATQQTTNNTEQQSLPLDEVASKPLTTEANDGSATSESSVANCPPVGIETGDDIPTNEKEQATKPAKRKAKKEPAPRVTNIDDEISPVQEPVQIPYQQLLKMLKEIDSSLTRTQLRAMMKAENISPMTDDKGNITVSLHAVQLEELKWKLRNDNEK